jgi:nucleoside-diphosphate-sugar epimerase
MRVVVTGGAGYLGSILVPMMLSKAWEVVVVDNYHYGQASLAECCADPNFTLIRGDARAPAVLDKALPGADFVVPLAAIVGAPACDANPTLAWTTNYNAVTLLKEWQGFGIVSPCTNSGYGIGGEEECTEDMPLEPISIYGRSKVEAERFVLGQGGISLRFATLAGSSPRMRFDLLVNDFCLRALRDRFIVLFEAQFRRNFLHIRDAARVIIWAIEHYSEMEGRAFNVGLPDANLTKWELCEKIKRHLPELYFTEAPVGKDIDRRDYIISNERILATGWRPLFSLDAAIAELIKAIPIFADLRWRNA